MDFPHTPLHRLDAPASVCTAGRLVEADGGWRLENARESIRLAVDGRDPEPMNGGDLVRVAGEWDGSTLRLRRIERVHTRDRPTSDSRLDTARSTGEILRRRHELAGTVRDYFRGRDFREVQTPNVVDSPGTDIYIDPFRVSSVGEDSDRAEGYLHTSPEFAMKRLLAEGCERIFRLGKVWRDCERASDWHHPEFTMLEWYRAWEERDTVLTDVERIVDAVTGGRARLAAPSVGDEGTRTVDLDPPFDRIAMRELVDETCGFDLLDALDYRSLREACLRRGLLEASIERRHPPEEGRWDELFFELMVEHLEPRLARMGAVFITDWPAPLAVLAAKDPDDPRIADRFELYVGGVELANGFRELTDPEEQRRRFEEDL
ncbi:MAG: amino acid--tRNA ligase-related protein, partial [Bradymonadaceae bacterium]